MFTHFLSFLFGCAITFFGLRYLASVKLDVAIILLTGKKLKDHSKKIQSEVISTSKQSTNLVGTGVAPERTESSNSVSSQTSENSNSNQPEKVPIKPTQSDTSVSSTHLSTPVEKKPRRASSELVPGNSTKPDIKEISTSTFPNASPIVSSSNYGVNSSPTPVSPIKTQIESTSSTNLIPNGNDSKKSHQRNGSQNSKPMKEPGTPTFSRQRSGDFNLADIQKGKRLNTSQSGLLVDAEFAGWIEIGAKTPVKMVWNTHYFFLKDVWLSWYKNETRRADQCYGWIKLKDCEIEQEISKLKIYLRHKGNKRLFHRHGPDKNIPPSSRSHFLFHRKSSTCRLRFKEEKALSQWVVAFQKAIDKANRSLTANNDTEEFESSDSESDYISDASISEEKNKAADVLEVIEPDQGRVVLVKKEPSFHNITPAISGDFSDSPPTSESGPAPSSQPEKEEEVNAIATTPESREGLLKILTSAIGLDVTSISLPVSLNEPTSFLQRMCEANCYYDLLNKANQQEDSCHRLTYVTAFAISLYPGISRTTKPFNPYLGETFQYVKEGQLRFLAEQVSHHPPVGAAILETEHFLLWQEQGLKTSFGGNSLACETVGDMHVILKKYQDHFCWNGIKTVVHNCIIGKMWIDHYGETKIANYKTGDKANLKFRKCGWFGKGQAEVEAWVLDGQGQTRVTLEGKWNEQLRWAYVSGPNFDAPQPLWVHTNKNDKSNHWGLSPFMQELLVLDDFMKATLPKTDSRFRPDRLALEQRDMKKAASEKSKLEKEQRVIRKSREQQGKVWTPQYFTRREELPFGPDYAFTGKYWEERNQRIAKASAQVPKQPENKKND